MSRIKLIGEHAVSIPQPQSKEDILFINESKDNAFWDREKLIKDYRQIWFDFIPYITETNAKATLYNQDGVLISLNAEDTAYIASIYQQEKRRRTEGVFFKNCEDIEWITGDHYFSLMWCQMQRHDGNGLFADYREFQRDFFYLIHHCWSSPNILGLIMSKAKKTGITNLFWLYLLNRATLYRNRNAGYMNVDLPIAAKTFRDYFLYSYNAMIPALRPQFKSKSETEGTIIFGKSYNNSRKAKLIAYDAADELNSSVFCAPVKEKAFDIAVMKDIVFDEPTKYKQAFGEIWRTNKEAVKIQSKKNGRAWIFNYTTGEDTTSFRETRDIFKDSKLRTMRDGKETTSGLIAYHLPANQSWEGGFDKYGRCDEKFANSENQKERDKVKGNKRALQTIIRQYANTEKEAWGSAGAGSIFDNIRLGDLLTELEFEQKSDTQTPYVEGRLIWDGKPLWNLGIKNKRRKGEFTNVKFVPLTEDELAKGDIGPFRMYNPIPAAHQNLAVRWGKDEYDCLIAPQRFPYVLGGDPTQYASGSEVIEGSKNAAHVISVPDAISDNRMLRIPSKQLFIEYFDRPELPEEAYEDYLKLIIYTGSLAVVEANAPYVATRLMEEGLCNFMMVKDENGLFTPWKRYLGLAHEVDKKYKLIRTTSNSATNKEMLEMFVRVIKMYFEKPEEGGDDYGKTFKSERALRQLMDVDIENTKVYDLFMSLGYSLSGIELYLDYLIHQNDDYTDPEMIQAVMGALSWTT